MFSILLYLLSGLFLLWMILLALGVRRRWLNVVFFSLEATIGYTIIGNMIPQIESRPPPELEIAETATPEQRTMAERMFGEWSAGEMPGPNFGEMGPGHDFGPGNMPSLEQMQAMGMSAEQIQMAQEHMQQGGMIPEGFGPGSGMEMEQYGMSPMEAFEHWAAENHMTPEMEAQYREMAETYQQEFENQNYDTTQSTNFDTYQPPSGGGGSGETLVRTETHVADHNGDGDTTDLVDTHPHEIYRHTDGTCHDHGDQSPEPC